MLYSSLSLESTFDDLLSDTADTHTHTHARARSVLWRNNNDNHKNQHLLDICHLYGLCYLLLNKVHKVLLLISPFYNKEPQAQSLKLPPKSISIRKAVNPKTTRVHQTGHHCYRSVSLGARP